VIEAVNGNIKTLPRRGRGHGSKPSISPTQNGAEFLGEGSRIGTLEAGKQADIVAIKGDPSRIWKMCSSKTGWATTLQS
jgi:hypothetical protein